MSFLKIQVCFLVRKIYLVDLASGTTLKEISTKFRTLDEALEEKMTPDQFRRTLYIDEIPSLGDINCRLPTYSLDRILSWMPFLRSICLPSLNIIDAFYVDTLAEAISKHAHLSELHVGYCSHGIGRALSDIKNLSGELVITLESYELVEDKSHLHYECELVLCDKFKSGLRNSTFSELVRREPPDAFRLLSEAIKREHSRFLDFVLSKLSQESLKKAVEKRATRGNTLLHTAATTCRDPDFFYRLLASLNRKKACQ